VGPAVLPTLEAALDDQRAEVRAAAARALRLGTDPKLDGLLAAKITGDRESTVRAAAIFAVSFRADIDPFIVALSRAATGDPAEHVRAAAVSLLAQHMKGEPDVGEVVARVAERDPKQDLRRLAREALERRP
jgi:hypothetical protein